MMKRVVSICAAILIVGCSAQAVLVDLDISPGSTTVNSGDAVVLNLWGNSDPTGQAIKGISLQLQWDPACLSFASYVDRVDGTTGGGFLWWDAILLNQAAGTATIDGAVMMGSVQTNVNIYTLNFTALAPTGGALTVVTVNGSIVRDLSNADIAGQLGSAEVNIVPEPMTLALLGLGGLMLGRKR